jgi:hypothetical protein
MEIPHQVQELERHTVQEDDSYDDVGVQMASQPKASNQARVLDDNHTKPSMRSDYLVSVAA